MNDNRIRPCVVLVLFAAAADSLAQDCPDPGWDRSIGVPGVDGEVYAIYSFIENDRPALLIGGRFSEADNQAVNGIARWRDGALTSLSTGFSGGLNPLVAAIHEHDDRSGAAIYAGGDFDVADGQNVNDIARWDGKQWHPMGAGAAGAGGSAVLCFASWGRTGLPDLFIGGNFDTLDGVTVNNIARWDGESFQALGLGTNGDVRALASFDDGVGTALYIGGSFDYLDGLPLRNCIGKWDGSNWHAVESPFNSSDSIQCMRVFTDRNGVSQLIVGGRFSSGLNILQFDGSSWAAVGGGVNGTVRGLATFHDEIGPTLCAVGEFTIAGGVPVRQFAKWDGTNWSAVGRGFDNNRDPFAIAVHDDGTGPSLFVGGDFQQVDGVGANRIARFGCNVPTEACCKDDGRCNNLRAPDCAVQGGEPKGEGTQCDVNTCPSCEDAWIRGIGEDGLGNDGASVRTILSNQEPSPPLLYVAGTFSFADGRTARNIAVWDGTAWGALSTGTNSWVDTLTRFDDGSGQALYLGGGFVTAGDVTVNYVAKWDGFQFSSLAGGLARDAGAARAHAFATFDDGLGPQLYVGGWFDRAGGVPASNLARWNGTEWSDVDGGANHVVTVLRVHDDGTGSALFAGGLFTQVGGQPAARIAKWSSAGWQPLEQGLDDYPLALASLEDTQSGDLYVGGRFTHAGNGLARHIARWNGIAWSPLGPGLDGTVNALEAFDGDGAEHRLYAGGEFRKSGDGLQDLHYLAIWDGTAWQTWPGDPSDIVLALESHDNSSSRDIYVGGSFRFVGGRDAQRIAQWHECPDCTRIRRLKGTCKSESRKLKATLLTQLHEGTRMTLRLDGVPDQTATINARGRARVVWTSVGIGTHEICIDECASICTSVDCLP